MGRARTVWLRSMLVTAMVVQAFGFVGSASANASKFVQVGRKGVIYNVPIGPENTISKVKGGFMIGTTEVTYGEWYDVRMWAEKNGYTFSKKGREGDDGVDGAKPTMARNEPVTNIGWYDVIVWSNAKSERESLKPVYVNFITGKILKKWKDNPRLVEQRNNGYRLPTNNEWEMAARWLGTKEPKTGSLAKEKITTTVTIEKKGVKHYWTPGNYASGAVENNEIGRHRVAWYNVNGTNYVGIIAPNALKMYDVSGNVSEITDRNTLESNASIAIRGGSWGYDSTLLPVSFVYPYAPTFTSNNVGFRLARTGN